MRLFYIFLLLNLFAITRECLSQNIHFKGDTIISKGKAYAVIKERTFKIYSPTIFQNSKLWIKKKFNIPDSSEYYDWYTIAEIKPGSTIFRMRKKIYFYELYTLDSTKIATTDGFHVRFPELDTRSEFYSFYYKIAEPFKLRFATDLVKFDVLRGNRLNKKGLKMLVGQSDVTLSTAHVGWCGTGGPIFISGYGGTYTDHDSIFTVFDKYRNIGTYKIHELLNDTTILSFEIHDWTGELLAKADLNKKDLRSCSIITYPDNKTHSLTFKRHSMNYYDGDFKRKDYGGIVEQVSSFLIRDKYF